MMKDAFSYLREQAARFTGRAAIVGKGPSFASFDAALHRDRFTIALNEGCLRSPCHAAFIIDEDILDKSAAAIAASGIEALLTPRVPHRPTTQMGKLTLYGPAGRSAQDAPWHALFGERHKAFNLDSAEPVQALGPPITGRNFSAPTLADLLARAGFDDILLAGIDGGTRYASSFSDLEYKKLRSVQNDFDHQFRELRVLRDSHRVRFSSVRCREAHVLIGAEAEQALPAEVLKWSLESNTFLTLQYAQPEAASRTLYAQGDVGTPFSFQRMFLPRMAGHRGRGVYFDSDMLVFKDVYALFNHDMGEHVLLGCEPTPGRPTQFSVFLVDNERAAWDAEALVADYRAGRTSYEALMSEFAFAQPRASTLPMAWNSLELFEPGRTANIHFTDMGTQPWLSVFNPNAELWCEALFQAIDSRPEAARALEQSLAAGWVRPSLAWQVEQRRADPWTLPRAIKALDANWLPPHVKLRFPSVAPRSQLLKWRLASRVRRLMQSRSYMRLLRAGQALRKVF
jgi:hypothetical protein